MLYDTKWNRGTLRGLTSWLESRPRDEIYSYSSVTDCLMCRYMGNNDVSNWPEEMKAIYRGNDPCKIARGETGMNQTYGAALDRAYAALADASAGLADVPR